MPDTIPTQPMVKRGINKNNASILANKRWAAYYQALANKADANHRTSIAVKEQSAEVDSILTRELTSNSAKVKALLSAEAVNQAESVKKVEPIVFKTVVEACDKLFGWSRTTQPSCLIQNNYLNELAPDRVPQPVVSCGVSPDTEQNNQKL